MGTNGTGVPPKSSSVKLGGELWCDSVVGQGCAFSLRLPLAGPQGGPSHA